MVESTKSANLAPALRVYASGATEMGRGRVHNDDTVLLRPDLNLFAVADGAGASGNVASAVATASLANYFEATERQYIARPDVDAFGFYSGARRLGAAVHKANRDIAELAAGWKQYRRMAATVVAVHLSVESALVHVANVGDSRCYRLRRGEIEQLSEDHSLMQDAIALRPDIADEELGRLPSNVVTRTLGQKDGLRVQARTWPVQDGDRFLVCSDGLTDVVSEDVLKKTLAIQKTPEEIAKRLIKSASDTSGDDNVAVVVLVCEIPSGLTPVAVRRAPRAEVVRAGPDSARLDPSEYHLEEVEVDDEPTEKKSNHGKTLAMNEAPVHPPRPRKR